MSKPNILDKKIQTQILQRYQQGETASILAKAYQTSTRRIYAICDRLRINNENAVFKKPGRLPKVKA